MSTVGDMKPLPSLKLKFYLPKEKLAVVASQPPKFPPRVCSIDDAGSDEETRVQKQGQAYSSKEDQILLFYGQHVVVDPDGLPWAFVSNILPHRQASSLHDRYTKLTTGYASSKPKEYNPSLKRERASPMVTPSSQPMPTRQPPVVPPNMPVRLPPPEPEERYWNDERQELLRKLGMMKERGELKWTWQEISDAYFPGKSPPVLTSVFKPWFRSADNPANNGVAIPVLSRNRASKNVQSAPAHRTLGTPPVKRSLPERKRRTPIYHEDSFDVPYSSDDSDSQWLEDVHPPIRSRSSSAFSGYHDNLQGVAATQTDQTTQEEHHLRAAATSINRVESSAEPTHTEAQGQITMAQRGMRSSLNPHMKSPTGSLKPSQTAKQVNITDHSLGVGASPSTRNPDVEPTGFSPGTSLGVLAGHNDIVARTTGVTSGQGNATNKMLKTAADGWSENSKVASTSTTTHDVAASVIKQQHSVPATDMEQTLRKSQRAQDMNTTRTSTTPFSSTLPRASSKPPISPPLSSGKITTSPYMPSSARSHLLATPGLPCVSGHATATNAVAQHPPRARMTPAKSHTPDTCINLDSESDSSTDAEEERLREEKKAIAKRIKELDEEHQQRKKRKRELKRKSDQMELERLKEIMRRKEERNRRDMDE